MFLVGGLCVLLAEVPVRARLPELAGANTIGYVWQGRGARLSFGHHEFDAANQSFGWRRLPA